MSRKTEASTPKTDPRVRRTRDALGDALLMLMQEKAFETITVQQVLDRAGIGRSTFYAHYRDKNDLFLSDLEDFLEPMSTLLLRHGEASNRVAPVRASRRCVTCTQH
jgi:AcrR family transcriptional regulator